MALSAAHLMAANPALCSGPGGVPAPSPFVGEVPLLWRDGIDYELDGLECVHTLPRACCTRSSRLTCVAAFRRCGLGLPAGKCSYSGGRLYLSSVRLVLVSRRDNPLRALDMPLVRHTAARRAWLVSRGRVACAL